MSSAYTENADRARPSYANDSKYQPTPHVCPTLEHQGASEFSRWLLEQGLSVPFQQSGADP